MKAAKGRKLEARGYRVTDPKDFLGLSDTEARLVELKVSLIERLKEIREANKVTQAELAKLLKSSQSRVAKIEAGASDVSLDLICRALFALGESPAAIEKIAMQAHRKHLRAASNRSRDLRLSARERAVLQLFAEGKSTKEIAGMLHVCVKTIEGHRKSIMEKLDLHSIAELTKWAVREGLTSLEQ